MISINWVSYLLGPFGNIGRSFKEVLRLRIVQAPEEIVKVS